MARRGFTYRGKTYEELAGLSTEQFAELTSSHVRRHIKRGLDKTLLKEVEKAYALKKSGQEPEIIRTHLRDMPVLPHMVGLKFAIHKGNEFQIVEIDERMVGHYLGEFALTRKKISHGKAGIGATKSSTAISARK